MLCWNICQSWPTSCRAKRPSFCRLYEIICFTSSLIRQMYHFCNRFRSCVAATGGNDIVNTLFKYWMSYRQLIFIIKTFELLMISSANNKCAIVCSLKKWTLKFKLLYLLNHVSYFNEICRICCLNTHVQSLKVWLKSVLAWLKYIFFSNELFSLVHPVYEDKLDQLNLLDTIIHHRLVADRQTDRQTGP